MNKVTFICGGRNVPATRFRVEPVAEHLRSKGWQVSTIYGYGGFDQRLSSYRFLQKAYRLSCRVKRAIRTSVLSGEGPVVIQRLALPWFSLPESFLHFRKRPLVFDFDDAVFLGNNALSTRMRRQAIRQITKRADYTIAGNSWLTEFVTEYARSEVIPTCIDTRIYSPCEKPRPDGVLRLGWIGTSGNVPYLKLLVDPLRELRNRGFNFDFRVCSDRSEPRLFEELGATFVRWSADAEVEFLQGLDLGLMPLFDDEWCRGKCSFKIIQYLAVGCPVVASSVGMNKDVLLGSGAGYLASPGEWADAIGKLLGDENARKRAGYAARRVAVDRFDIHKAADSYERILSAISP